VDEPAFLYLFLGGKRMKINRKTFVIALICALVSVSFFTCVDQDMLPLGTEAELVGLRIGDVGVSSMPTYIPSTIFENEGSIYDEDFGSALFNREIEITNARIRPSVSRDATAEWGIGNRSVRPSEFFDTRVPTTFESEEYIYIKVTSGDKLTVRYYRFYTMVYSWVTDLASIEIAEREAKAVQGASSWNNLGTTATQLGNITITRTEAANAVVTATTFDPNAKVRFARLSATASGPPSFQSVSTPISFNDQDFLYVEVTAENTVDITYFRFRVHVGRLATIASLKFNDGAKDIELFGVGLTNAIWGNVGPGSYATAKVDQPTGGFQIKIELEDPEGTADWQIYSTLPGNTPATATPLDKVQKPFNNGDWLVIRVLSFQGNVRSYYKIQVTLLAANIKQHPQSAWYYATYVTNGVSAEGNKTVAPLKVIFADGTNTAGFTYQWYEADSLFGIYGRHGVSMDEKNNISTINGGPDMYYYLSQPDVDQYGGTVASYNPNDPQALAPLAWPITGATTDSYTPRVDWTNVPIRLPSGSGQNKSYPYVPSSASYNTAPNGDDYQAPEGGWPPAAPQNVNFFTGSTSEVRYYWCVVYDPATQLYVTTDRAVILTETNKDMDHYIFELSKLPRKNVTPFKKLRELYKIELSDFDYTFPTGFDPSKYEICIAQAQYYLPDGRPWTQNWTHGDMHFGYTPGKPGFIANGNAELTWWHNNLGANSGSIPLQSPHSAQGGLGFRPDWIGFAPSGDKGRGLPPLDTRTGKLPIGYKPDGYPTGQAQGYFCGFIELMELRFATAPK
jgi:hypothetical protein